MTIDEPSQRIPPEPAFRFPVVTSLAVEGYQLFPGARGEGFRRQLFPGVTIIAGVNGLGKTTLLHLLYRGLTGPADSGLGLRAPLGSQTPTIRRWDPREFFGRRVEDGAQVGTVDLTVAFGDESLRIRRRIRDLSLERLSLNDVELELNEHAYQLRVVELAGLPRFEDLLVLLQYLIFVFEERPRVVWDPTAQAELFRFIVNPAEVAGEYRATFDAASDHDSARRNIRVQVNKLRAQLANAERASTADREVRSEIDTRELEAAALRERVRELSDSIRTVDEERRHIREALLQDQHRHEDAHREYVELEQQYLRSVFPSAEATAQLVFARSDTGCLICGTRSDAAIRRIRSQVERRRCPLCDSPAPPTEPEIAASAALDQTRLRKAADEADGRQRLIRMRERRLSQANEEFHALSIQLGSSMRRQREIDMELQGYRRMLPPDNETIARLRDQLQGLEARMEEHAREQAAAEARLTELVDMTRTRVESLRDTLRERFQSYASEFLEETCELVYHAAPRRVGQEGRTFVFPSFHVRMTTALSPEDGRPRLSESHVSESQKEFIDLAFRMALINAVAGPDGDAMMVLETPESSLDQVFAARAGRLLGSFARGTSGSRVVATSNVTSGPMISAMLGAVDEHLSTAGAETQPHFVSPADREDHVINLLLIAAENAAVRRYREDYAAALERAMYPERGDDQARPHGVP